jgi:hypothetical protein
MGPRNAYKDVLDNVVSPLTCVSMNHQNQLEQMANGPCSLQLSIKLYECECENQTKVIVTIYIT